MNIFDQLLADNQIPKFVRVRHEMDHSHIDDIEGAVAQAMRREGTLDRIKPGDSVCITAGSRDVANIARIIRAICDQVKSVGAHPFIIPAMGSHAGAKAEGQRGIIEGYGVTEEAMGAPIRATMDTEVIAHSKSGLEIHLDKYANAADFLIPVGRIKAHTDFRGEVESGICKMLVIGMGKQHGAYQCHKLGFKSMAANVKEFAGAIIEKKPNMFAIGLIENAYHQTCRIEAIPAGASSRRSRPCWTMPRAAWRRSRSIRPISCSSTRRARTSAARAWIRTSRAVLRSSASARPFFQRIAVFDLTDKSHGNFGGLGSADVTTQRLYRKIDFEQTYPNGITAAEPLAVRLPVIMPSDRTAMQFALRTATDCDWSKGPRIVWLKNTLSLSEFYISEALLPDAEALDNVTVVSEPMDVIFDEEGNVKELR